MPRIEGAQITREQLLMHEMRVDCRLREEGLDDETGVFAFCYDPTLGLEARDCFRRLVADSGAGKLVTVKRDDLLKRLETSLGEIDGAKVNYAKFQDVLAKVK